MTSISTPTTTNNNFEIPKELLKKAAESALVSSFVDLNTSKVSPLQPSTTQNSSSCHKVVIDLVAKKTPQDSYDTSVFVKVIPRSSQQIFKSYEKEIKFFSEFQKEVEQQNSKARRNIKDIHIIPKCYLTHHTEENVMIFLENIKSSGFSNTDSKSGLDFNHALVAIETLARFHANSYFLRRQLGSKGKGKLELLQKFPYLKQPQTLTKSTSNLSQIFANIFEQIILKLVEAENPSVAFKLRRKIEPSTIFDKIPQILENEKYDNDDFYVACHGDFRSGNLLFKYPNNSSKEPVECRMVDFKRINFAPLASDLTYFFFTSTSGPMREEFEEKLLAFYCDTFEEHLTLRYGGLGQAIQDFDIEDFHRKLENQYKRMLEFGFYNACIILPLLFAGEEPNLESLEGFESKERFDTLAKESLANCELQSRIFTIVKQLVKNRIF